MAKTLNATKGNVTVTNGVLRIVSARMTQAYGVGGAPNPPPEWIVGWVLYTSQAQADIGGQALDRGEWTMLYVVGKDPVEECENVLFDYFKDNYGWTATEVVAP